MLDNIKWVFLDVGSTIVDEHIAYEHRMREVAERANVTYDSVYKKAMEFYHNNQKGDLEIAKLFGVELTKWHEEDEILYEDARECLHELHGRYHIGIIANQSLGTAERLKQYGVLEYIDLVIASAEEGVSKPDKRIFEIALNRAKCTPEQSIMIGDRIDNDIIPAKRIGMKTIWIKQGFGRYWKITKECEKASYEVNCLTELLEIL